MSGSCAPAGPCLIRGLSRQFGYQTFDSDSCRSPGAPESLLVERAVEVEAITPGFQSARDGEGDTRTRAIPVHGRIELLEKRQHDAAIRSAAIASVVELVGPFIDESSSKLCMLVRD